MKIIKYLKNNLKFIGLLLFLIIYFFIGMDIIYWELHKNDDNQVNYTFNNGHGGTGTASRCYKTRDKKFCKDGEYTIEVAEYSEVEE